MRRWLRLFGFVLVLAVVTSCQRDDDRLPNAGGQPDGVSAHPSGRTTAGDANQSVRAFEIPLLQYSEGDSEFRRPVGPPDPDSLRFSEIHSEAGLQFVFDNGARGQALMVEGTSGGTGWLDYDGDRRPDLLLGQGGDPVTIDTATRPSDALYRNRGDGTFQNVALSAGLTDAGYSHGVAAGDFDNDGFDDVYITSVGPNVLYRNQGDGTFLEVTTASGTGIDSWSSSAAWGDLDLDGDLDLYVCKYLAYDVRHPLPCKYPSGKPGMCHPKDLNALPDECFFNQGDGSFTAESRARGLFGEGNKALGVVLADFNNDGLPDVYVANDTTPNFLFINQGGARFRESAALLGCAVNGNGYPEASMGLAVGDYNGNGFLDVYATHFTLEQNTLYANLGPAGFHDVTARNGLRDVTLPFLGFGTAAADFNSDGYAEIIVANGHIDPEYEEGTDYKMNAQIFSYLGETWKDCTATAGPYFTEKRVGRALATSDFDDDGDLDVAILNQNDPAAILRNDSRRGHWLKVSLIGRSANRRGIGTRIVVRSGEYECMQEIVGGSSYCASHEPSLVYGLGQLDAPVSLEIRWPSGQSQVLQNVSIDQHLRVLEPDRNPKAS